MKTLLISVVAIIFLCVSVRAQGGDAPASMRRLANDYYGWRNQNYPVSSSDAGLHTWDSKLTDYAPAAVAARRAHVADLLARVKSMRTHEWAKDDQIDWLLFRAQLESPA